MSGGKVAEVGVGDRLGPRGWRLMERLANNEREFYNWIEGHTL